MTKYSNLIRFLDEDSRQGQGGIKLSPRSRFPPCAEESDLQGEKQGCPKSDSSTMEYGTLGSGTASQELCSLIDPLDVEGVMDDPELVDDQNEKEDEKPDTKQDGIGELVQLLKNVCILESTSKENRDVMPTYGDWNY